MCILFEELGWVDAGLAISFGVTLLPALMSVLLDNPFCCREVASGRQGRLLGHHRARHGSDMLDANRMIFHPQGTYGRPNCVATLRGDEVIINGQKAAGVQRHHRRRVRPVTAPPTPARGPDTRRGVAVNRALGRQGRTRAASPWTSWGS